MALDVTENGDELVFSRLTTRSGISIHTLSYFVTVPVFLMSAILALAITPQPLTCITFLLVPAGMVVLVRRGIHSRALHVLHNYLSPTAIAVFDKRSGAVFKDGQRVASVEDIAYIEIEKRHADEGDSVWVRLSCVCPDSRNIILEQGNTDDMIVREARIAASRIASFLGVSLESE